MICAHSCADSVDCNLHWSNRGESEVKSVCGGILQMGHKSKALPLANAVSMYNTNVQDHCSSGFLKMLEEACQIFHHFVQLFLPIWFIHVSSRERCNYQILDSFLTNIEGFQY